MCSTGIDVLFGSGKMSWCVGIGVLCSSVVLEGIRVVFGGIELSTMLENGMLLWGVELTSLIGIVVLLCSAELICARGFGTLAVDV